MNSVIRIKIFPALSLLVLLVSSLLAFPGLAQEADTPTDDEVNAIAKELYCPVCENVPLDVCPTQACAQWRATIREKLALGWTEREIKDYFVQQYGDRVLATPPAEGFNWLIYLLPGAAFIAGAYILGRAVLSWRQESQERSLVPEDEAPEDPYIQRLEDELERRA